MLRLAHFSDVHLTARPLGWRLRDLVSKKVPGWLNVKMLGRGARFKHALRVVELLRQEFAGRGFDHLIFSGDATTLGFDREFSFAAELLGVLDRKQTPCLAVPGNHDAYTRESVARKLFNHHFAPWLHGQRVDEHAFPFARKVGPAWLIAVNSSTANFWSFDASGAIGPEQLNRLKLLCRTLDAGPRIMVTHYPLRAPNRKPERRSHRLRDHREALAVARDCGIGLWLHGHIHKPYILTAGNDLPFPTICAGSCTQTHRWCYNDYTLDGDELRIVRRRYQFAEHRFADEMKTSLKLSISRILSVDI